MDTNERMWTPEDALYPFDHVELSGSAPHRISTLCRIPFGFTCQ
jgi:hypothetical protein